MLKGADWKSKDGTFSKILNYHIGLSKETIRTLSEFFKMTQKTFNRPYELKNTLNKRFKKRSVNESNKKKLNKSYEDEARSISLHYSIPIEIRRI